MYLKETLSRERDFVIIDDEYVPLTVRIGDRERGEIYLRYVSNDSLLELGISSIDGTLTSIKLVQTNGYSVGEQLLDSPLLVDGLPQFDTSLWNGKKLLDIENSIDLSLTDDSVLLILDSSRKAKNVLRNRALTFAVADGYPCWVRIERVTDKQMASIRLASNKDAQGGYL